MKKLLNVLLALMLCLGLVACGGSSDTGTDGTSASNTNNKTDEPTVIDITMDNWQEYFEIKDTVYVNPMGECRPDTHFVLKDTTNVFEVNFDVEASYVREWRYVEINDEEQTIVIGELVEDKEVEHLTLTNSWHGGLDEFGNLELSFVPGWDSQSSGDIVKMTVCSQFELTSISGTITYNK